MVKAEFRPDIHRADILRVLPDARISHETDRSLGFCLDDFHCGVGLIHAGWAVTVTDMRNPNELDNNIGRSGLKTEEAVLPVLLKLLARARRRRERPQMAGGSSRPLNPVTELFRGKNLQTVPLPVSG
jgi:hypothetical protein